VPLRLVAVRLPGDRATRFYVNPRIVWQSDDTASHQEGSVSMPGVVVEVKRPRAVRVAYLDLEGRPESEEATGFAAAVLQHEIDQLDGVFFIERLSPLRRDRLRRRWSKQNR
jgi:peptide deformylase